MGEGPAQQKALIGPEDTTSFTGGFDSFDSKVSFVIQLQIAD